MAQNVSDQQVTGDPPDCDHQPVTMELDSLKMEMDSMQKEIRRLEEELTVTSKEKHQSAELGLQLLDEKEELQRKYFDLEANNEMVKNELELLRNAFNKIQNSQKVSAFKGIEQEESLLKESANKEACFTSTLMEFERELKQVRQELERVQNEKERLFAEHQDVSKQLDIFDWERKSMRSELKELKHREARLLTDFNELEEENISLQKQVSNLRSNQIDYETAKLEVRRLQEELELRRLQVEELDSLKKITESQMKAALEALESEREQKYELKKKLDEKINNESILNMSNLGLRFPGLTTPGPFGSKNQSSSPRLNLSNSNAATVSGSPSYSICPTSSAVNQFLFNEHQRRQQQQETQQNPSTRATNISIYNLSSGATVAFDGSCFQPKRQPGSLTKPSSFSSLYLNSSPYESHTNIRKSVTNESIVLDSNMSLGVAFANGTKSSSTFQSCESGVNCSQLMVTNLDDCDGNDNSPHNFVGNNGSLNEAESNNSTTTRGESVNSDSDRTIDSRNGLNSVVGHSLRPSGMKSRWKKLKRKCDQPDQKQKQSKAIDDHDTDSNISDPDGCNSDGVKYDVNNDSGVNVSGTEASDDCVVKHGRNETMREQCGCCTCMKFVGEIVVKSVIGVFAP